MLSEVFALPEKQWCPDDNPVVATLTVVGVYTEQKTPYQQFKQPVQLKDEAGISSEVIVQTKFADGLMTEAMKGIKARWRCKWFSGRGGEVIVGYCLDKMGQAAPSQPQQAAPATPQSPQASNVPQRAEDRAEGMVRHGVVCAYISAGNEPVIGTVDYWTKYIMTGKVPLPPGQSPAMGQNDDIPF